MKSAIVLFSTTLLFACATNQPTDGSTATTDFFSGLLSDVAGKHVDKQAKIQNMEVTQKLGNTLGLQISYKDLYSYNGLEFRAKAMDKGARLPGIQSTSAVPNATSGNIDLVLSWQDAKAGQTLRSSDITIEIMRDGNTIKSRTFKFGKLWTASTAPDSDAPAVRPVLVPATILPLRPATTATTPTTVTPAKPAGTVVVTQPAKPTVTVTKPVTTSTSVTTTPTLLINK